MNNKAFAPIVLILIIAGILAAAGGGVYFYEKNKGVDIVKKVEEKLSFPKVSVPVATTTETKNKAVGYSASPTADWKTYRNEQYGFEVKIPNTWIIYDNYPDGKTIAFSPVGKADDSPTGGKISVENNTNNDTLDGLLRAEKERKYYGNFKALTINGQPAFSFSVEFAGTVAKVIYKGKIFTLVNEIITNPQILSTFKFIIPQSIAKPEIIVLSPNGEEMWRIGKNYQIQFKIAEGKSGYVDLSVFPEGSEPNYIFNSWFNNQKLYAGIHTIDWTIPQNVSPGKFLIGVYFKTLPAEGDLIHYDTSDTPFSIVTN